jgi:hypothetical protein
LIDTLVLPAIQYDGRTGLPGSTGIPYALKFSENYIQQRMIWYRLRRGRPTDADGKFMSDLDATSFFLRKIKAEG